MLLGLQYLYQPVEIVDQRQKFRFQGISIGRRQGSDTGAQRFNQTVEARQIDGVAGAGCLAKGIDQARGVPDFTHNFFCCAHKPTLAEHG